MKKINLKALLPVGAAILIFILITFVLVTPAYKGKSLLQSDAVQIQGMAKEIKDFGEKYDERTLWTNSMFGGMPAYQISVTHSTNMMRPIRNLLTLNLPYPASTIFLYMFCFYILLLTLKVDKWLGIIGAVGFGLSSFFIIVIAAGHYTQAIAISFIPPVLGGLILVCRGKYFLGGALLGLFSGLELFSSHVQITYYLFLLMAIYVIFVFVERFKLKQYKDIFKITVVLCVIAILAVGTNLANLWTTSNYVKYTIRGPSELSTDKANRTTGLDRDYVTQWSMGKGETLSLLIPGFKGRTDGLQISENKNALKEVEPDMREVVGSMPQYWGDQPTTSSPYSGAILVFLFVFGLFVLKGNLKWSFLVVTILSVALSWGKNMMWFTDLALDYLPFYNKFRAVTMTLVLAMVTIPILATLVLDKIIKTPDFFNQKIKLAFTQKEITVQNAFFISFGLTGGLSLLFYLMPDTLANFTWIRDSEIFDSYAKNNGNEIAQKVLDNIEKARISIFKSEAIRSFLFISAAGVLIWLFSKTKINKTILIAGLTILVVCDLGFVDKSFLNDKNFVNKKQIENPFPETVADKAILQDKDISYRVFDLSDPNGPFNSARASYFHKSIGGYHAVKLRRYQELIENQINRNYQNLVTTFRSNPTETSLDSMFAKQSVLNMLNTRYIIYNTEAAPLVNKSAIGNVWFVKDIKMVNNADEELKAVGEINPSQTVVVDKRYEKELHGFTPKTDSTATIKLTDYKANHLKYESNTTVEQLAVFSEIYYDDGWNAYVDGELKPHFGGDWVLRVMRIPAGKHTIEFKFEPDTYEKGEKIAIGSGIILLLLLIGALFIGLKQRKACDINDKNNAD